MRRLLSILFALALVFAGLGVVRPQVIQRSRAAWAPVGQSPLVLAFEEGTTIEITQTGEYVAFVEGPAGDTGWSSLSELAFQLTERQTRRPLPPSRRELAFSYDLDGRHAQAVDALAIANTGTYELGLGRAAHRGLDARGFEIFLCPLKVVDAQAWKSRLWLIGGIAAGVLMGLVALSMLSQPRL